MIGSSIVAFSMGFLAIISKAIGAADRATARKAVSQAVLSVLVIGIGFTVITLSLSGEIPKWMQVDEKIQPIASSYFFIMYLPMLPERPVLSLVPSSGPPAIPRRP